jgi:hypothetical protein
LSGIIFMISFSFCSLLIRRKASYFYVLILYLATLLKVFIISRKFLVEFLGSFKYRIILSSNRDNLTSSFCIWKFFISLSCFKALTGNFTTIFNKSGKNRHPYLVSDFRGNDFSFLPFSMILTIGLSHITFTILRYIPSIPNFFRSCYYEGMSNFVKDFFCIY